MKKLGLIALGAWLLVSILASTPAGGVNTGSTFQSRTPRRCDGRYTSKSISNKNPDDYYNQAMEHFDKGQLSQSLAAIEMALSMRQSHAAYRVHLARLYRRFGRFKEAMEEVNIVIAAHPGEVEPKFERATLNFIQKDFISALQDYTECIQLKPTLTEAYYNRAMVYEQLHNLAKAKEDWELISRTAVDQEGKRFALERLAEIENWMPEENRTTKNERLCP